VIPRYALTFRSSHVLNTQSASSRAYSGFKSRSHEDARSRRRYNSNFVSKLQGNIELDPEADLRQEIPKYDRQRLMEVLRMLEKNTDRGAFDDYLQGMTIARNLQRMEPTFGRDLVLLLAKPTLLIY